MPSRRSRRRSRSRACRRSSAAGTACRPACRSRTRTSAVRHRARSASWNANRPRAARTTPRIRADRRAARSALRVLVDGVLAEGGVSGGHAALPSVFGARVRGRAPASRRSADFLRGSTRQIPRTRPGAATNMITSAWMNNRRSSGMPGLHLHQPAARAQRAEQQRRDDDPQRPVAGQQRERDGVEAEAGADVVGHLGRRSRGPPSTRRGRRARPRATSRG